MGRNTRSYPLYQLHSKRFLSDSQKVLKMPLISLVKSCYCMNYWVVAFEAALGGVCKLTAFSSLTSVGTQAT